MLSPLHNQHCSVWQSTAPTPPQRPNTHPLFLPHSKGAEPEFRSPRVRQLWDKWRTVWLLAWERQRRLHARLAHLKELQRVSNFSWDDWRKRFLKFMNHKKSRLTDLFRKMDKDNNGLIPRNEFIDGIINTSKYIRIYISPIGGQKYALLKCGYFIGVQTLPVVFFLNRLFRYGA